MAAALAVAAAGCGLGRDIGRCPVESRSLDYGAETMNDSLVGDAFSN